MIWFDEGKRAVGGIDDRPMRRREFLTHFAGLAAAVPLAARAQPAKIPLIGFLNPGAPRPFSSFLAAFHQGLNAAGYVEGQNVAVEYRWAEGDFDRLREQAGELVRLQVAVIVATGGSASANAARNVTDTIPILFVGGADPIKAGLVTSFNRPGGNATGVSVYTSELMQKRMELLSELVPKAEVIALLVNPNGVVANIETEDLEKAVVAAGRRLLVLEATDESRAEAGIVSAAQQSSALLVSADPFFTSTRDQIVALAARHKLPAGYAWREFVATGGLMSYGPSITDAYRQIGDYAGRILKGAKPDDLPVRLPTKFDLVINLKTAKALGLTLPRVIYARANELIE
jgi:putative ABC transport system substrate-binding protein